MILGNFTILGNTNMTMKGHDINFRLTEKMYFMSETNLMIGKI